MARELADPRIGARNIAPGSSGVAFTGVDLTVGYRANLWLRSAIRVLTVLAEGDLNPRRPAGDTIYDFVRSAVDDWCYILPEGRTFMAEARVWSCSNVSSSHLVVQRVRDAVCDELRDRRSGALLSCSFRAAPPCLITILCFQNRTLQVTVHGFLAVAICAAAAMRIPGAV